MGFHVGFNAFIETCQYLKFYEVVFTKKLFLFHGWEIVRWICFNCNRQVNIFWQKEGFQRMFMIPVLFEVLFREAGETKTMIAGWKEREEIFTMRKPALETEKSRSRSNIESLRDVRTEMRDCGAVNWKERGQKVLVNLYYDWLMREKKPPL